MGVFFILTPTQPPTPYWGYFTFLKVFFLTFSVSHWESFVIFSNFFSNCKFYSKKSGLNKPLPPPSSLFRKENTFYPQFKIGKNRFVIAKSEIRQAFIIQNLKFQLIFFISMIVGYAPQNSIAPRRNSPSKCIFYFQKNRKNFWSRLIRPWVFEQFWLSKFQKFS